MAVKTYDLTTQGNVYCSKHTQVKEMACKDGSKKVLVDESLMNMIEKLFSTLKCTKYIISSGYRTPAHDKKVGGNGKGQHTLGKAVDACFYGADGKIISAKEVSCIAQDLGFKGIANINSKYQYIHLDMRSSGKYYGNEIKGYNTVTSDFYSYYGIDRDALRKKYGLAVSKPDVIYQVYAGGKWWGEIKNYNNTDSNGYAGTFGKEISGIRVKLSNGKKVTVRSHLVGKDKRDWLAAVHKWDDTSNGYSGWKGKPTDCITMKADGYTLKYRVHIKGGGWLSWVNKYDIADYYSGLAGAYGKAIDAVQIAVEQPKLTHTAFLLKNNISYYLNAKA